MGVTVVFGNLLKNILDINCSLELKAEMIGAMTLRIILVTLSIMIGACSTAVKSIKNEQVLKKDSGVFFTKLQTNYPFQIAIRNSEDEIIRLKKNSKNTKILC